MVTKTTTLSITNSATMCLHKQYMVVTIMLLTMYIALEIGKPEGANSQTLHFECLSTQQTTEACY